MTCLKDPVSSKHRKVLQPLVAAVNILGDSFTPLLLNGVAQVTVGLVPFEDLNNSL